MLNGFIVSPCAIFKPTTLIINFFILVLSFFCQKDRRRSIQEELTLEPSQILKARYLLFLESYSSQKFNETLSLSDLIVLAQYRKTFLMEESGGSFKMKNVHA